MQRAFLLCALVFLVGCDVSDTASSNDAPVFSNIEVDEHVEFFPTSGWLDEENQEWHVPIHGWIYEPEDSSVRRAVLEKILEEQFDLTPNKETAPNLARRLNLLIADNERDKTIVVSVGGRNYELPPSAENGHFKTTVVIPAADADKFSDDGLIEYSAVTRKSETRKFRGQVQLVGPAGLSIISDIDDTVKITNVTNRKSLLEHTFLLDFVAAPGMAQLYGEWAATDVSFHYVSSSPWQLYAPLAELLARNNFPWATFSLKAVRFRDETILELFKEGTDTKPAAIEEILGRYPGRQFVLVGDSGEQDPEVYASLIRKHPKRVLKVYIRNVTRETPDNARFVTVFDGIAADRWQLFEDPQSLMLPVMQ